MNEEAILELYNELSTDYEVGDIDQFKAYLQDPKSRVDFFEQIIKPVYAVEDIADFEAFYGLKKKDDTEFGLEGGSSELTPLSRNQQLGVTPTAEKDTAIERMFGKNEVTDFFGDLYRSGVQGQAQGATVDDALNLFAKGQDISDEDLKEYIESVRNMESFGPSEEMQDFTKIYEKNGKGLWGFLSGVAQNPTVIPQLFTSSVSAMFNKGSIAGGVAGAVTGGVGAGLATGGIAAIPGALIGGIGGVSGALETGLSYTEFLKEELDKEGLSFDEDNVKKILLNEEAMNSIKNKALARGLTIAAIDAFSGGLATSITRKTATKLGSKLAGAAAGGTVEALGGATGEAAARLVAGQEMDIAEIGFEGVAGTATAPLTIGAGLMKPPSYSMNGGKASRKDIQTLLSTGTPEQIARRSSRNKARRVMGDKVVKGMDVGHKDNNPMNNDPSNLRNEDPSDNRREPRLRNESTDEALDMRQRLAKSRSFRRYKSKIKLGRDRAKKRMAKPDVLKRRANKAARNIILKKLTKGIPKSELSFARRNEIEKRLDKPNVKKRLSMLARRMYKDVRKKEVDRKKG